MMFGEDRRLRTGERPTLAILTTWLCVSLILIAVASARILENQYPDPDDALRLVQVRDLIAGQGWYDLHQYRMTPPDGTLMHWSRLVDLPIAAMILFLSLFMDMALAERVTMVIMPLIVLLLTMLVIGRLAWRLFDRQHAIYACAALVLLPFVAIQFQPMRIDHHGWQILCVAVALWAISWRKAPQGGAVAGFVMAAGLMISLETIFLSAGFAAILLWRWLQDTKQRWWLVSYLQALALGLVLLFAATRGLPDLAAHCDAISPPHLGFFLIVALGAGFLAVPPTLPRLPILLGLGATGVIGLGFIGWSAPQCLAPPFSNLDPLVRDYWYLNVTEGRPVWFRPFSESFPAIVQSLLAIGLSLMLAARSRDWARNWWFEYAFILLVAFLSGVMTFRSMAFAGALSAIPMGWLISRLFKRWRAYESLWSKLLLALGMYMVLLPAAPIIIYKQITIDKSEAQSVTVKLSKCELRESAKLLNRFEPATLFAPLDIGPALLLHTHHGVVASGHHRAEQAMRDVIDAYTDPPERARITIDRYEADYLVVCMDLAEPRMFKAGGGPDGLMSQLSAGNHPDWLEPVDIGAPESLKIWRVSRD